MSVEFALPGRAVDLLAVGSPGEKIHVELGRARIVRGGRGRRAFFSVDRETALEIADYLDSVAGAVGVMTSEEAAGGRGEGRVARAAADLIYDACGSEPPR